MEQEIEIWQYEQIHKPQSVLENEMHKNLWDFDIQTDHLILVKRPDLEIIKTEKKRKEKKRKENLPNHRLCCPGWPQNKTESGALRTVTKGLAQELKDFKIRERVETIKTTALLRSAWILGRVLVT